MTAERINACAQCATLRKTCCQTCEILVTPGDQARIAGYTGQSDFWEYRRPDDPSYTDAADDPNWPGWVFRPDGTRAVLRRRPAGDCLFLGPAGCGLPMEIRPLVCRLYPFEYNERGITGVAASCPADVVPEGRTIIQVLDMRLEDAVRWHWMLYAELRTKEPWHADRPDFRRAG